MPQKRNPLSVDAKARFRTGEKLVDIAQSIGKPAETVRRWKFDQDWEGKEKQTERSALKANIKTSRKANARFLSEMETIGSTTNEHQHNTISELVDNEKSKTNSRHPNARPGNKNALGNIGGIGGPKNNKHAVKTHEFEKILFCQNIIDDAERGIIADGYDKYVLQYLLLDTLTIREKRIMRDIKELRDNPNGTLLTSLTERSDNTITEENMRNKRGEEWRGVSTEQSSQSTSTTEVSTHTRLLALEDALTRVQGRKQRAIEILHRMELDEIRAAIDITKLDLYRQRLAGVYSIDDLLDAELDSMFVDDELPAP